MMARYGRWQSVVCDTRTLHPSIHPSVCLSVHPTIESYANIFTFVIKKEGTTTAQRFGKTVEKRQLNVNQVLRVILP